MKKGKILTAVLLILGICLVCASVITFIIWDQSAKSAAKDAKATAEKLYSLMPEPYDSFPDNRTSPAMPMVEIDGRNYIGILEIPAYGTSLPIGSQWDSGTVSEYPCRYLGSTYDSSLIIGGSDNKGQLDFVKKISNEDLITVTDTTGQRFTYKVTDIRRTKDVSTENLTSKEADLVLFARNTYSLDYTVIRCTLDK